MKTISTFFNQLYLTFSEKPSLLSSKKIERFFVFSTMLPISIYFIFKNIEKLDATSLMIVVGGWLGYAGYNTIMVARDKQLNKTNTNDTSQPIS